MRVQITIASDNLTTTATTAQTRAVVLILVRSHLAMPALIRAGVNPRVKTTLTMVVRIATTAGKIASTVNEAATSLTAISD